MTREEYIENYVVHFLAVWTANNFNDYCSRGKHKQLENPPFEDAVFLAAQTWDKFQEFCINRTRNE
jgi:hypothetical protein